MLLMPLKKAKADPHEIHEESNSSLSQNDDSMAQYKNYLKKRVAQKSGKKKLEVAENEKGARATSAGRKGERVFV